MTVHCLHQRGAVAVELALTIGYFILLVLAAIEMAMLLNAYVTNSYLAREAVRFAVVRGTDADKDNTRPDAGELPATQASIQAYVNSKNPRKGAYTVTATWPDDGAKDPGDRVQITVTHIYQPMVIPGSLWIGPTTLTSSSSGTILY